MTGLLTDKVEFNFPLESDQNFPPTIIAAQAKLHSRFISLSKGNSAFDKCAFTHSGRTALALAGKILQRTDTANVILIPSFHCPAAVEPFIWLGYKIAFFKIEDDLKPDLSHIKALVKEHDITHCLLINYFGFRFITEEVADFLKQQNIKLISDCAHSIYALLDEVKNPNSPSDATICSINKMLPTIDGGLIHARDTAPPALIKHDWWTELKAIAYTLGIVGLLNKFRKQQTAQNVQDSGEPQTSNEQVKFRYFSPDNINSACFAHTEAILRISNLEKIANQRRKNFDYLVGQLSTSSKGRPTLTHYRDGEVPYVFPFLAESHLLFNRLREANIQCLRWEEVAHSECSVSQHYRKHLLQIPCHHMLTRQDLDTIVEVLK